MVRLRGAYVEKEWAYQWREQMFGAARNLMPAITEGWEQQRFPAKKFDAYPFPAGPAATYMSSERLKFDSGCVRLPGSGSARFSWAMVGNA